MDRLNMLFKLVFKYRPLLHQCQKRKIFMSVISDGRTRNRLNPYSAVLKDDMFNLTPDELQKEITFISNMPLQGIMDRQNIAEMDIKLLMKRRKFKNIERKYFRKEPEPCFLTCSMKEQIRNLYMLDSSLWTPVNLSYVFPATLPEIKKLIRDKPSNLSEEKQQIHDKNVIENWKRYAKDKFGSIALLKKTITSRFSEISETKLPAATLGDNKEVKNFINSLKFTEEDDEIAFQDEKSKKHLIKLFKKCYPFKETFKEIISNYDNDLAKLKAPESGKEEEGTAQNEMVRCKDLSEILPAYKKDLSESYIKVSSFQVNEMRKFTPNSLPSNDVDKVSVTKSITYEDFIHLKDNDNVKSRSVIDLIKKGELERALILTKELLSTKAFISTATINLLLQQLSESGDYTNIEFIGDQLCEETRTKTKVLDLLIFAYQKMGETNLFLNRVLSHCHGHCEETLVIFIPSSVMSDVLIKDPHLEASIRECAHVAATGGDTRMMAGLLNAYLILMKLNKADEIYSEYFENVTYFNISVVCHQSYKDNNYLALNSTLELLNRRPAGREKMKAFIYSTIIDLLSRESKFKEVNNLIDSLSSQQNLEFKHIRKGVMENLKLNMENNGMTFPYDLNNN